MSTIPTAFPYRPGYDAAPSGDLPVTPQVQKAREAQSESQPGFFRAVADAAQVTWTTADLMRQLHRTGYEFDPNFTPWSNADVTKQLTDGIPPDRWGIFNDAVSYPHAQIIREQELSRLHAQNELASLGWKGAALGMLVGVADPVTLAATIATGGEGAVAYVGTAGRMARLARAGIVTGAVLGGLEATRSDVTAADVAKAAASGFGMGAAGHLGIADKGFRAVATGLGGALPTIPFSLAQGENVRDTLYGAAGAALFGAVTSLPHGLAEGMHEIRRNIEYGDAVRIVQGSGMVPELGGVNPAGGRGRFGDAVRQMRNEHILGEPGKAYFKPDMDPTERAAVVSHIVDTAGLQAAPGASDIEARSQAIREGAPQLSETDATLRAAKELAAEHESMLAELKTIDPEHFLELFREPYTRTFDAVAPTPNGVKPSGGGSGEERPPPPTQIAGDFLTDPSRLTDAKAWDPKLFGVPVRRIINPLSYDLGRSESGLVRTVATGLAQDALFKEDGTPSIEAGTEWRSRVYKSIANEYEARYADAFHEWAKANGKSATTSNADHEEFGRLVTQGVENPNLSLSGSDPLSKAAKLTRDHYATVLSIGQRHGIEGFDKIGDNPFYSPHILDVPGVRAAHTMFGNQLGEMIGKAFHRGVARSGGQIGDDVAAKVGKNYLRKVMSLGQYTDLDKSRLFGGDAHDLIRQTLVDEGVAPETIEKILYDFKPSKEAGKIDRAKRRLPIDPTYQHTFADGRQMRVSDLYLTDANRLAHMYLSQVLGSSAESRLLAVMSQKLGLTGEAAPGTAVNKLGPHDGWKLHLAAPPENLEAISKALKDQGIEHKVGRSGGQTGKDITAYIGSKADAQSVADKINKSVGHLLDAPRGEPLKDDASFGGKVMGRFDVRDPDFHQYGAGGIPHLNVDVGNSVFGGQPIAPDALKRADAILRQRYGSFYTGEKTESAANAPLTSWDQLRGRMGRELDSVGTDPKARDRTLAKLDYLRDMLRGVPITADHPMARLARNVRGLAYIQGSGGFGVAMLPGLAVPLAEMGPKAMMDGMPAWKGILSKVGNGKADNETLAELHGFGLGADGTHELTLRLDDTAATREYGGGALKQTLDAGGRLSNLISGFNHITRFIKNTAALTALQKFGRLAFNKDKPLSDRRLASLGLRPQDGVDIGEQLRTHGTWDGDRLVTPNFDRWSDHLAASNLITAIDKWSRRAVHDNDVGNLAKWMTADWARTLLQFRMFHITSFEKQFLQRLQVRDAKAFGSFITGTFIAATAYAGQQYLASLGRPDAQKFRDERLSLKAIGLAGVQRGGWASLMPQAFDTVWGATGGDPVFAFRNSGLAGSFLDPDSNPTMQMAQTALGLTRGVGKSIRDHTPVGRSFLGLSTAKSPVTPHAFDQSDADDLIKLLPFSRALGVSNALQTIRSTLPESHR